MDDWFRTLAAGNALPLQAASQLQEQGYVVLPGAVSSDRFGRLRAAYDAEVALATGNDIDIGTTSTRVTDFVNRGPEFDDLYHGPRLLHACCLVIGRPFKLSSLHSGTLRSGSTAQWLHVDVDRRSPDWPLLGFILMVDEFRPDNGATRFVPGSHRRAGIPAGTIPQSVADADQVAACGPQVPSSSSMGPRGMGTAPMPRPARVGPFKAPTSPGTAARGLISRHACSPRPVCASAPSPTTCSQSDPGDSTHPCSGQYRSVRFTSRLRCNYRMKRDGLGRRFSQGSYTRAVPGRAAHARLGPQLIRGR